LAIIHIHQPFGEKCRHVRIVSGGPDENLGISHPPQSLIPLRTVGWDAQIIAALAPLDIGLQLIDPRV
jgi:hypothetical protein